MVEIKGYIGKVIMSEDGTVRIRRYKDRIGQNKRIPSSSVDRKRNNIAKTTPRSRKRTRQTIFELVNNNINNFYSFTTLTFEEEIDDYDTAYGYMKKYIRKVRDKMPSDEKLIYLVVPELQEERSRKVGKNIYHFHMLSNIKVDSELIPKRKVKKNYSSKKGRYYSLMYYDLPYWNHGFSSAIEIDDNAIGIANYLSKYLSKDDSHLFGRRKIIASKNLKRNVVEKIDSEEELNQLIDDYKPYLVNVYTHIPSKKYMPIYTEYEYRM